MKDLTELCDYIDINVDNLLDFICSIDICYIYRYRDIRYKPSIYYFYCEGNISTKDVEQIENYNIWLSFFCDYSGYNVLIYYPKKVKKGELVKVIFKGLYIDGFIYWRHRDIGLFSNTILPLLFLDKLPPNDFINIDMVKRYASYENTKEINTLLELIQGVQITPLNLCK